MVALLAATIAVGCGTEASNDGEKTDTAVSDTADGGGGGGDTTDGGGATDDVTTDAVGSDGATGDATGDATADVADDKKHKTCPSLGDCVIAACAPKAFATGCHEACFADASDAAAVPAVGLLGCVQTKCLPACKDSKEPGCLDDCMGDQCITDLVACISHGTTPSGTETCMQVGNCFDSCGMDKTATPFACNAACLAKTDAVGAKALADMAQCMAKNGDKGDEACAKEMFACVTSGKSGDKACFEIFGCAEACQAKGGSDDQCMFECLPQLTKEAQGKFADALPCMGEQMTPECAPKFLACIDPSGTKTCLESFGCMSECSAKAGEGKDPASCIFGCMHNAKKEAATPLLGVMGACNDGDDAAPLPGDPTPPSDPPPSKACMSALVVCIDPPAEGQKCPELLACNGKCAEAAGQGGDSMACGLTCATKGAKAEVLAMVDFVACNSECELQCKDSKDETCGPKCMSSKCPDALAKCVPNK